MIELADAALESWLATLEPRVDVAFLRAAPDDGASGKRPTMSLVLSGVREQTAKRDNQVDDVRDADGRVIARQRATRFFELDYLCSVDGEARAAHQTLGAVVQLLVDHDVIPADHLPGELAELGHPIDVELVATSLPTAAITVRVVMPVRPTADRSIGPPATDLHLEMRPPPGARYAPTEATGASSGSTAVPIEARKWTTVRRREMIAPREAG